MPYTPTSWVSGTTPADAPEMNNLETIYAEATNSFEQDLFTPYVHSGLVATKDGTTVNQLDVTTGVAFLTQSDGTLRRRAPAASTAGQFLTSTPSTTYYLFLNKDGTWTWGTTSTGPANSLAICQATTDVSGNISVVTDKRQLFTTVFNGAAQAGVFAQRALNSDGGHLFSNGAGKLTLTPSSAYDAIQMYATNQAFSTILGTGDASFSQGAGAYAYDTNHAAFIYSKGLSTGITFNGTVTAGAFSTTGSLGVNGTATVGGLITNNPVTLAAGNQETGKMGGRWTQAGAGSTQYAGVNFKATMTNTPTSITAGTADFSENFSTLTAAFISKTGFALSWLITGSGVVTTSWIGPYTTAGNCVKDVNATAQTFTHHCDVCDLTRTGLSMATDVDVTPALGSDGKHKTLAESQPGAYGIAVQCPCGAREMLNTGLTTDDEAITALTPDGQSTVGELARQVRALQAALGLPMVA